MTNCEKNCVRDIIALYKTGLDHIADDVFKHGMFVFTDCVRAGIDIGANSDEIGKMLMDELAESTNRCARVALEKLNEMKGT